MTVRINADGTTASAFTIGIGGATIRSGTTVPSSSIGNDGDWYIRTGSSSMQYQKVNGNWIPVQSDTSFTRSTSVMSAATTIPDTSDYHGVTTGTAAPTDLTLPIGSYGKELIVKNETNVSQPINIFPSSGDAIEGGAKFVISSGFGTITAVFFNGAWKLIRSIGASAQ